MHICQIKTKVVSGENALEILEAYRDERVMIICDKFLEKNKTLAQVTKPLLAHNQVIVFTDILQEPTLNLIGKCIVVAANFKPTVIIGLGGGAALDTTKGVVYFATSGQIMLKPAFLAIPTTSGTGSEMTNFAVFTDTQKQTKSVVVDDLMYADIAILDPTLTLSVPPAITANTGFDVLTHAVEAYVTNTATVFTDAVAAKSFEIGLGCLPLCYNQGENMIARAGMLEASNLAGIAFTLSGLGIAHSMAHQLGAVYHVPHGLACALCLPAAIEYNAGEPSVAEKYAKLAFTIGIAPSQISSAEAIITAGKTGGMCSP